MSSDPSSPSKILTVGPAVGSIRDLFAKIKSIDAKHGKFDLVLCVGDFFGPLLENGREAENQEEVLELLQGGIEAALPTYVMQGQYPLPEVIIEQFAKTGGQLAKNVHLFTKSGIFTTANGIKIACVGGTYDAKVYSTLESAPGFTSPLIATHTIHRLLSNTLTKPSRDTQSANYSSLASIQAQSSSSQLVDILLTNIWPSAISLASNIPLPASIASSLPRLAAPPLDEVITKTKPRYHFCVPSSSDDPITPMFWEREPYLWSDEDSRVSRFVSLGSFGGAPIEGKKQRWFYAFSIAPSSNAQGKVTNVTPNPFTIPVSRISKREAPESGQNYRWGEVEPPTKRSRQEAASDGKPPPGYKCRRCEATDHFISDCPERSKPPDGYICKICNVPGHLVRDCPTRDAVGDTGGRKPREGYVCRGCGSDAHYLDDCPIAGQRGEAHERGRRRGPPKEITSDECWFCLSNPNLAKHLIVSIGEECYVTLPKGQIIPTRAGKKPAIPGGGHVLIIPISHHTTLSTIPAELSPAILAEVDSLKRAVRGLYSKHHQASVFFEVARLSAKGGHAHVQAIPIPNALASKVEEEFIAHGKALGIEFEPDPEEAFNACQGGRQGYFRIDLPDGRMMIHVLRDRGPFPLQFGRQVLVDLLAMPEREDWKACMLSEEDDKADAMSFKTAFAPFDPSLS